MSIPLAHRHWFRWLMIGVAAILALLHFARAKPWFGVAFLVLAIYMAVITVRGSGRPR